MKRIIVFMLVAGLSMPVFAQQSKNIFEQLTEEFADKDGFSASQISNDMFDLYLKTRDIDEDSPVSAALNNLDNILVISQSKVMDGFFGQKNSQTKTEDKSVIHKTILEHYKMNNYTLLKTEKRMGEDVKVYLKKNKGVIESLALVTNSTTSTNLVELQGDIDLKTVSELNKALNLRGLENLYKIDNNNSPYHRALGLSSGHTYLNAKEILARQREFAEQHKQSDKQREQIEEQAKLMAEKQVQMAEKYREMAEKYRRQPIFLNYPGDTNTVYFLDGKKVTAKEIQELDRDKFESVEVNKGKKENDKTTIRIKTK